MADVVEVRLVILFVNLSGYTAQCAQMPSLAVARVMQEYYQLIDDAIASGGGRVVKFIGDAALAVFPIASADDAARCVVQLKDATDRFLAGKAWTCRLNVRMHAGVVAAGDVGTVRERRYDVLGAEVNATVRLAAGGITLSAEAHGLLSADTQQSFVAAGGTFVLLGQSDTP